MERNKAELKTFEDLECWKACRDLRKFAAMITKKLPREEGYRLKDQILRAARSTTANLAEGYSRFHYQEKYTVLSECKRISLRGFRPLHNG